MATKEQVSFKVTFEDRKVWIRFHSAETFMKKCREKFKIDESSEVCFLDSDNTEVDEDCFDMYQDKTEFTMVEHKGNLIEETEITTVDAGTASEHPDWITTDSETGVNTVDAGKASTYRVQRQQQNDQLCGSEEFVDTKYKTSWIKDDHKNLFQAKKETANSIEFGSDEGKKTVIKKTEGSKATTDSKEGTGSQMLKQDKQQRDCKESESADKQDEISWTDIVDTARLEKYIAKNDKKCIQEFLQDSLECWKQEKVNIAVIGQSGKGKSSLINAFMYFNDADDNAAEVGEMETTMRCQSFCHPKHENIIYWDIPGCGTENFPEGEEYMTNIKVERYDFFLLVSSERFPSVDIRLAKELLQRKKKLYFVRSKVDIDMNNLERRAGSQKDRNQLFAEFKTDYETSIVVYLRRELKEPVEIFLVSSHFPDKYEFENLRSRLVRDATVQKKVTLIFGLEGLSKPLLDFKIEELRKRMKTVAIASLLQETEEPNPDGTIPFRLQPIMEEIEFYLDQLSLNKEKLGMIEKIINLRPGSLKKMAEELYPLRTDNLGSRLKKALEEKYETGTSEVQGIIGKIMELLRGSLHDKRVKQVVKVLECELTSMKTAAEAVLKDISFSHRNIAI